MNRRNTRQRQQIYELLARSRSHPTADWVYQQLKPDFPSLSLGTVYRNLRVLCEEGSVRELRAGGTLMSRFEGRTETHPHVVCRKCGAIEDCDIAIDAQLETRAARATAFHVEHHHLSFVGLCPQCAGKSPKGRALHPLRRPAKPSR